MVVMMEGSDTVRKRPREMLESEMGSGSGSGSGILGLDEGTEGGGVDERALVDADEGGAGSPLHGLMEQLREDRDRHAREAVAAREEGKVMEEQLRAELLKVGVERDRYKALAEAQEKPAATCTSHVEHMLVRLLREKDLYQAQAREAAKYRSLYEAQIKVNDGLRKLTDVLRKATLTP